MCGSQASLPMRADSDDHGARPPGRARTCQTLGPPAAAKEREPNVPIIVGAAFALANNSRLPGATPRSWGRHWSSG